MARDTVTAPEPELAAPSRVELVGIAIAAMPVEVARPVKVEPPTSDQWAAQTLTLDSTPRQVAGDQRRRSRAILRNLDSAGDVILTTEPYGERRTGYVLPPGGELELRHTQAIYAHAPEGEPELSVILEHVR